MRSEVMCLVLLVAWVNAQDTQDNAKPATEENEICHREKDQVWVCKKDTECAALRAILREGGKVKTCSWKGLSTHIICCPPIIEVIQDRRDNSSTGNRLQSISEQKCITYRSQLCSNGQYQGPMNSSLLSTGDAANQISKRSVQDDLPPVGRPIVGGELTIAGEHPHMAAIGYGNTGSIQWMCGGSLISETFVLSAAHCAITPYGLARWVRLGDPDMTSFFNTAIQQFEIVERIIHPGYHRPTYYNDIVLFRLDREAVFDRLVGPACLHTNVADLEGRGVATGWGRIETNGPTSPNLLKVALNFSSTHACKEKVGISETYLPEGVNIETMICAGEPGKDTCQGDSGGPLVLFNRKGNCLATQVGVTSFGPPCGESISPGVYVRVAHFLPWIESVVWPQRQFINSTETKNHERK